MGNLAVLLEGLTTLYELSITGIISSGRVTSPPLRATLRPTGAPSERTEIDKKQPTAPASGEDLG